MEGFQKAMPLNCMPETQPVGAADHFLGRNSLFFGDISSKKQHQDQSGVSTYPRGHLQARGIRATETLEEVSHSLTALLLTDLAREVLLPSAVLVTDQTRFMAAPGFFPCRPWGPRVQWPDALVLCKSFQRLHRLSKTYICPWFVASIYLGCSKSNLFFSTASAL
jgi:hypothetical protein